MIIISIFLSRVGRINAVILPTLFVATSQIVIWPTIQIPIWSTRLTISSPSDFTLWKIIINQESIWNCVRSQNKTQKMKYDYFFIYLADIIVKTSESNTFGIFITEWTIRAEAWSVMTSKCLISVESWTTLSTVEGSFRVDTPRVIHTSSISSIITFVHIIAPLSVPSRKFQPLSLESLTSSETNRTRVTTKTGGSVDAAHSRITWFGQITLIKIVAVCSISSETHDTWATTVVGWILCVMTLNTWENSGEITMVQKSSCH